LYCQIKDILALVENKSIQIYLGFSENYIISGEKEKCISVVKLFTFTFTSLLLFHIW